MSKRLVLVIASPADGHVGAVLPLLEAAGCRVLVLAPERLGERQRLMITSSARDDRIVFEPEAGCSVELSRVDAAWYRRPRWIEIDQAPPHRASAAYAVDAWRVATDALYALLDCSLWVSHPDRLRTAARPSTQLALARSLGFSIPKTLLTNDPAQVRAFCREVGGRIVMKPTGSGWVRAGEHTAARYAVSFRLTADDLDEIDEMITGPVIVQEEIPRAFEIRVNVIGRTVLATRVDDPAGSVARPGRWPDNVQHVATWPYRLPDQLGQRCLDLTGRLGLEFGVIDLIHTPDGDDVFLEIDGSGAFLWDDGPPRVHVAAAIADLLAGHAAPLASNAPPLAG